MNAERLEALIAMADECYADAWRSHPHLFVAQIEEAVNDEEHAILLILAAIDQLVEAVAEILPPPDWDSFDEPDTPEPADPFDDIPF